MRAPKSPVVKPNLGSRLRPTTLSIAVLAMLSGATVSAQAAVQMYVDTQTKQVFIAPGVNRVLLSEFEEVNEAVGKVSPEEIKAMETKLRQKKKKAELAAAEDLTTALTPKGNWTDRINLGGYTQLRYSQPISGDHVHLTSPGDKSVAENQGFFVRRARIVLSGNISDHLYFYSQTELAAAPSNADQNGFAQIRDMYADISFDDQKEYRIRAGVSKVPYGFEILQSSSNRLAMDRADAVNIASRDERELGVMFYWAPSHIRDRFRDLVRSGLKGSGDYGVLGIGVYNGQGLNRLEANDNKHRAIRLSYPFKFDSGQFFEVGASALSGKYVPTVGTITGLATAPTAPDKRGLRDERIGLHAVLYPQPFGLQSEWNWGHSPELTTAGTGTAIKTTSLNGGYVQAMYKLNNSLGDWMPYVKWQKYDGSEKFSTNAPHSHLRETEAGVEWQPRRELELTVAYANMNRTNLGTYVSDGRNLQVKADMIRVQAQWNY
jgi:hypothetical protein